MAKFSIAPAQTAKDRRRASHAPMGIMFSYVHIGRIVVLYIRNAIAQDWGTGFGARLHRSGIQHSAYLSKQVARSMAPGPFRGAYRGATGLVGVGLCSMLDMNFREFLFHALR